MSWFLVFLGFSLLIMLHEAGHYFAAKATGMRVERFFLFFGPTIWSFKRGETEYGIKAIPLGGYVKITGMNPEEDVPPEHEAKAYHRQKVWKRVVVIAAGPAVNIALAFVVLFAVFRIGGLEEVQPVVGETLKETPAAKVLRAEDKVVAIDGHSFPGLTGHERIERFGDIINSQECAGAQTDGCLATEPVKVTVRRDGQLQSYEIHPKYDSSTERMMIGVAWGGDGHWVPISSGEALDRSTGLMGEVVSRTGDVFAHIFESKQRGEISGIVGTSDVGHQAVEEGWRRALLLLALVSLSLGLINLLPILPLDGGHILWAVLEKLRGGRPVSLRVVERATVIGFALVFLLMFIGLTNDIGRITGEGFNVSR
jgi:regulator of sigma E protease